ncbi:hypothetical protein GCM10008932_00920 [Alkalibacterium iburiense]|uniref:NERD domain-containing protein n=1 Tax=Alkalibacterium iburiense TaxID=290589 RepID=A0ABP3GPG0_9LACT
MIIKERTKPIALRVLEALNGRSSLTTERKREYWTQIKGYEGEKEFDKAVAKLVPGVPVLNDLMLKDGSFLSQVDSLMIIDNTIRLFEIKNMTGEYTYSDDALHADSGLVYTSPIVQVRKSSSLIQNLIRKNGPSI